MNKLDFKTAFKYPFNRTTGLSNILWILLPFIGWFALGGYSIRIVQEFSNGKFKHLPIFKFDNDFKLGFFMFLKALPFIITYIVVIIGLEMLIPWFKFVNIFLSIFIIPMLSINFFNKETVYSFFEFKILKPVFIDLEDYTMALLKEILLAIVFLLMYIVLVGLPAGVFTKNIFLADFYRRKIK